MSTSDPATRTGPDLDTPAVEAERRVTDAVLYAQLGALSAAVANELRNPLTGISGAISAIARSLEHDDERRAVMMEVANQVRRLDDLVRDLLDFAQPTATSMTALRLDEVALEVVERHRVAHAAAHIATEGEGSAWADRVLVRQILHNLLTNALHATDGEGEILVQVWPGVVLVSDSGPGIPAAHAEEIFAPFFTTRTRGTGLGLAICRKAALAMGGQIALSTGPLQGAAFRLELPRSA